MSRTSQRLLLFMVVAMVAPAVVHAQNLRFGNHREIEIPDYATIKIGPFYSQLTFAQTVAYRYTETSGSGTDFVFSNNKGDTLEDGSEFPLVSKLTSQNYMTFSRNCDLEFSFTVTYMHFPLQTQENEFDVQLGDDGAEGNFSAEFRLNENWKGTLRDDISYRTDYVDARGEEDKYGGSRYEVIENTIGMDMDWLVTRYLNVPLTIERTDTMPLDGEFDEQEKATTTPELGVEYELTGFLLVGFNSSYEMNTYPASDRPDSTLANYETFAELGMTKSSSLRTAIGYTIAEADAGEDGSDPTEDTSVVGEVRLHTDLSEHLSHELYGERTLTAGYEADFDLTDAYGYQLDWKGDLANATLSSVFTDVTPSDETVTTYSDVTTSASLTFPPLPDVTTTLTTSYEIRENGDAAEGVDADIDTTENYDTWVTSMVTSFNVLEDVTCAISLEHMERYSDTPELEFGRDIAAIEFTYTHAF